MGSGVAFSGSARAARGLDALNFFLADVEGGLGPYLAVYLLTVRQWNQAEIGFVLAAIAASGLLLFWAAMPETRNIDQTVAPPQPMLEPAVE